MQVRCRECGHVWSPRYDRLEYEPFGGDRRLRCTADDCNNGKRDGFEMLEEDSDEESPSPVEQAELETKKDYNRARLVEAFRELLGVSPRNVSKTDSYGRFLRHKDGGELHETAPEGFETVATRMYHLYTTLDNVETEEELDEFEETVDEVLESMDHGVDLTTDIDALEAQVAELQAERDDLQEALQATKDDAEWWEEKRDENKEAALAAEERRNKLRKESEDLEAANIFLEACETHVTGPEEVVDKLDEIDDLREEIDILSNLIGNAKAELSDLEDRRDRLEGLIEEYENTLAERRDELDQLQERQRELQSSIEDLEAEEGRVRERTEQLEGAEAYVEWCRDHGVDPEDGKEALAIVKGLDRKALNVAMMSSVFR